MQAYTRHVSGNRTKQDEVIPGKAHLMTKNSDGAFVFKLDDWKRLERFLILGSDQNTYYASAKKLTRENATVLEKLLKEDNGRVVDTLVKISDEGRAPNNDPALFALALCAVFGNRRLAMDALPKVARIGTHLFHFLEYTKGLGIGWGRSFKRGVSQWFNDQDVQKLAYQVMKYKSRDGWSMRDGLRLAHPNPGDDPKRQELYRWITKGDGGENLPAQVAAADTLMALGTQDIDKSLGLIREYRLPREVIPTELLNNKDVWDALLEGMPVTAMIRNLGKMTNVGLLAPLSSRVKYVSRRLKDVDLLKKGRVHPITVLAALRTYRQGKGDKGHLTWDPIPQICAALEEAFYMSFKTVEPSGKNIGLFLDVSGSMTGPNISGLNMSPRTASAVMAMVTMRSEEDYAAMAFSNGIMKLRINPAMSLEEVETKISLLPFSSTNCSLPMTTALKDKIPLDAFIIYTDSETNHYESLQPAKALEMYRQKMGRRAKLIVVGMVSSGFTIADPSDSEMLDVVGFDSSAPAVMSDFIRS